MKMMVVSMAITISQIVISKMTMLFIYCNVNHDNDNNDADADDYGGNNKLKSL